MSSNEQPSPTQHAIAEYTQRGTPRRHGVALCLSGGGYRAALFHLGALRRLNELGVLSTVETISSVSGGSVFNGHLADTVRPWPEDGSVIPDWDRRIAEPMRAFTRRNIRTRAVLRRLLPWNWRDSSAPVEELARQYRRLNRRQMADLLDRPRFIFCATDVTFGVNWVFDSGGTAFPGGRIGDYQAGYVNPLPPIPIARAMAASSCFPPVFDPLRLNIPPDRLRGGSYKKDDRDELVGNIGLSDGGVYDNLGLEPVWKSHRRLLVSDGGGVFEGEQDIGWLWRIKRYTAIQGSQVSALRKRWLISNFISKELSGVYWGIGSAASHYAFSGQSYSEQLVDDVISEIRTDLDRFSGAEQCVLENHGYIMAEAAIKRHATDLISADAPFEIPHPAWMDERAVRDALRHSHKRTLLGRTRQEK